MTSDEVYSRRRSVGSATWATLQQFITLGSTALSGIILARVLPVADFGVFSYATNLASMGTVVIAAGLAGLAIKSFVDDPSSQRRTMTALIVIRELFAAGAYLVLLLVAGTANSASIAMASALALAVLFARALDAGELWFQSRAESSRTAPVRIAVVLVALGVRLAMAFAGADVTAFLVLYVVEAVAASAALMLRYLLARESPRLGMPEYRTPLALLARSWLLVLSSVAAQINTRGDVVVIQILLGSAAVGIYSAAARLSEMLYFLPVVFMTATFPRLLQIRRKHGRDSIHYRRELQSSYDRSFWVGLGICVAIYFAGPPLLTLLYGQAYSAAGDILRIHVLALPFVFMAAVFSKWIIAENLLLASLIRHAFGAVLNIALNFALIPSLGLVGSAWATVGSYVVASYLSCFVGRSTRPAAYQMSLALIYPIRLVRDALRSRRGKVN